MGSGCGSVGRAVASDAISPRFKSSHRQTFTSDCIEKKKKEAGDGPFLEKNSIDEVPTAKAQWIRLRLYCRPGSSPYAFTNFIIWKRRK